MSNLVTIHWKFVKEGDTVFNNVQSNDELSCNAYMTKGFSGPPDVPKRWADMNIGIEVLGHISWLEAGDAWTGHGRFKQGEADSPSGDNKAPRALSHKPKEMRDVILDESDWDNLMLMRAGSDFWNEALVDNWEPNKVWYIKKEDKAIAEFIADDLSVKFGDHVRVARLK
jgi:hypothetical protein